MVRCCTRKADGSFKSMDGQFHLRLQLWQHRRLSLGARRRQQDLVHPHVAAGIPSADSPQRLAQFAHE
ncbi:toxin-antitoxin system HicB family antitoxin [bacterium]|nr:toxin-antitoxin system HicB family antitoxin [bacterium]